jgi:hypothetical protein
VPAGAEAKIFLFEGVPLSRGSSLKMLRIDVPSFDFAAVLATGGNPSPGAEGGEVSARSS